MKLLTEPSLNPSRPILLDAQESPAHKRSAALNDSRPLGADFETAQQGGLKFPLLCLGQAIF